jgi:Bardet-Biedl syndrome 1 protein
MEMADDGASDTIARVEDARGRMQSVTLGKGGPARKVWLNALTDPVAGLSAYSACMHTCNLLGDGEWRLVVADSDKKLKVWKGTQKQSDNTLLDTAVAITSFISDTTSPRIPFLAVASGSHVYIYRNLRPFYKFVLPPEPVDPQEQEAWCVQSW